MKSRDIVTLQCIPVGGFDGAGVVRYDFGEPRFMSTFCESPCLIADEPTICRARICLIRHSAQGNRDAIELLFERVYSAVYKQAKRICHGDDETPELAQEALVLAFEGLAYLKNPQLLLHWMNQIAWNRHRERHDGVAHAACIGLMNGADHPVNRLILRETAETLAGAVRSLPPSLHEAFRLRVLEQLPISDAALRLGISEAAVTARLRRARVILREALAAGVLTTPDLRPAP